MYLVIDTSTQYGATGLWADGALVRAISWRSRRSHTVELMPAVDQLFRDADVALGDLRGIAVSQGPGGFSALRAGLGAAKGLAFATGAPLVGVSTLEASAYPYRDLGYPVCALIPAGRELVAWARFQQTPAGWKRRTADRVSPLADVLALSGRHVLFCGEGSLPHVDALRDALGRRAHFAPALTPADRLLGVAALGAERLDRGESAAPAGLEPRYLRPPGITPPKPPRPVRLGGQA